MDPADSKPINRVALACIQCRSRHVKCDATQPVCNRCHRDGKECTYHKSRRGGLDKAALARRRRMLQQQQQQQQQSGDNASEETSPESCNSTGSDRDVLAYRSKPGTAFCPIPTFEPQVTTSRNMTFQVSSDRLLDVFYENFWQGFPFTLPHRYMVQRRHHENHGMDNLLLVIQWIGSMYAPWTPSEPYYGAVQRALTSPNLPRDPWTVQALILAAVAQQSWNFRTESGKTLDQATTLALELGMNTKEFARAYGESDPVLEESWRRTYFLLALTDRHFAVIVNSPVCALLNVPNMVDLPCDDEFYESGQIPPPRTWQDYNSRDFDEVEIVYGSIVYMTDMNNIVQHVMRTVAQERAFSDHLVATIDAKVAAWHSLLPACKKDPMRPDGTLDEIMFQAHLMAAIILIGSHRQFSLLTYSMEELATESFASPIAAMEPPKHGRAAHTARVLKAIDIEVKLLAIPCAIERHNIFTANMVATVACAQIAACNHLLDDHALAIARDRVRLSIGCLNALGSIWPQAKIMAKEVRHVARSALSILPSRSSQEPDPSTEIEIPRDDMIWPVDPLAQIDLYAGLNMPFDWDASFQNYTSSSTPSLV